MKNMPSWLVIVTAPIEVFGCAVIGAWRGAKDGCLNVRDALAKRRQ